ncbi:coronin [Plakobranchus ocellatus]|uniref:Coronin n=1 Tax=Plakobranchus ocellatus TaxID=259542 RepID=A0AAV4DTW4_9GAST|nr:coronin [Plakobranchus ocellatus]
MAWRFKVSKYKNASPKFPKKEEQILDLPVSDITQSCGNHIKASCIYVAFNIDSSGGGNLGFLPLSASGRQSSVPIIQAHGDFVTDFDFSPFDDYLLATGSQDNKVSLWLLPDENDTTVTNLSEPVLSLPLFDKRVENVLWNPQADGILACTSNTTVKIYDVTGGDGKQVFEYSGHEDQIQSVTWQGDGNLLATSCRDKKLRVIDLRANAVVQEGKGHQNPKDSRLIWLPRKDFMISTGFSQSRSREVKVWDPRNLSSSVHSMDVDSSTGIIMPFFDADTSMTFLIGKGDTSLNYLEFTEKEPFLTASGVDRCDQIKGAAMVPKRAMSLMDGEVNRLMILCQKSIVPAPYIVPRKSYRDFHADIYPVTLNGEPALTAAQWINGDTADPVFISPEPGKKLVRRERRGMLVGAASAVKSSAVKQQQQQQPQQTAASEESCQEQSFFLCSLVLLPPVSNKPPSSTAAPLSSSSVSREPSKPPINKPKPQSDSQPLSKPVPEKPKPSPKPAVKPFAGVRQSKFRHIQGKLHHPSSSYTNLRKVSKTVPGESDMFAANELRCAVPLDGPGGDMHVLEFSKACKLADTDVPVIRNGSKVTDFVWDPFDDSRLVVVTDNARINVWRIPEGGLEESTEQVEFCLRGHMEKIYFVRFHPLASGLIATASYDMTVRLWDLEQQEEVLRLDGIEEQVYNLAWSSDGKYCATVSKDKKIRVFEPRASTSPLREGEGPEGSRGARIVWTLQDKYLVVTGFDRMSAQQILVYRSDELEILHKLDLIISPAILVPFYDPDSSVLFLNCRGDRIIGTYEVSDEEPHLFDCAPFKMETTLQGVSFLPKRVCDVRAVEVARAWRLTDHSVEGISFNVPRVKTEFFQDDLFPATRVTWKPTMTAAEWLAGANNQPEIISLKPADMTPLSEAPQEAPKVKKFESYNPETFKTDQQRKDELLNAMVGKLDLDEGPLPQEMFEGVDEDEWDD